MMEKYIPYEKLSKKDKRKLDSCRRKTWGNLNPVTRKPANSKVYNRKKNGSMSIVGVESKKNNFQIVSELLLRHDFMYYKTEFSF